jgi:hypothetical protein
MATMPQLAMMDQQLFNSAQRLISLTNDLYAQLQQNIRLLAKAKALSAKAYEFMRTR